MSGAEAATPLSNHNPAAARPGWISRIFHRHITLSIWPLADQSMVSLSNFLTNVIISRVLGPHQFGVFTLVWSAVLLAQLLQFCLITTPMYSLEPGAASGRRPPYFGTLFLQESLFAALVALALLASLTIGASLSPDWPGAEQAIPLACAAGAYLWQDWAKRGLFTIGKPRRAFASDMLSYLVQLALLAAALGGRMSLELVLWVMAATSGAGALLAGWSLRPLRFEAAEFRAVTARHWQFSRWILGAAPLAWIVANMFQLVSGALIGVEAVAGIRAASLLFAMGNAFFFSLENFIPNRAAHLLKEEGIQAFFRFTGLWIAIGMTASLGISLVLALAPRFWLSLAFGPSMADYAKLVYPFALQFPMACFISLGGLLLRAAGLTSSLFRIWGGMALVATVTAYPAIRLFGIDGAMGSFLFSYLVGSFATLWSIAAAPKILRQLYPPKPEKSANYDFLPENLIKDLRFQAEYTRLTAHLVKRSDIARGEMANPRGDRIIWCVGSSDGVKSMACAIFRSTGSAPPDDIGRTLAPLIRAHRPDGMLLRVLNDVNTPPPRFLIREATLFLSQGAVDAREVLPLPDKFDAFLASLGKKTRSHIRSSLRSFAAEAYHHDFREDEPIALTEEIERFAAQNMPLPIPPLLLRQYNAQINEEDHPFISIVRDREGSASSIICGYLKGGDAMLVYQLNPSHHKKMGQTGPSLLHRALLIKLLTERGFRALIMVNGCAGMLRRYCLPAVAVGYLGLPLNPLRAWRSLTYVLTRGRVGILLRPPGRQG